MRLPSRRTPRRAVPCAARDRRHDGAQHERTEQADFLEPLPDDAPLERFDVDGDIGQLRHRPLGLDGDRTRRPPRRQPAATADAGASPAPARRSRRSARRRPHEWSTVRASMKPLASTSPTVTGARPCWIALRSGASRKRSQTCATAKVSAEDGAHIAIVQTSAPRKPSTFHPIRLTISMLGPGAACAIANACAKSASVSQCAFSTTRR